MKYLAVAIAVLFGAVSAAQAVTITQFTKSRNDGVFSLSKWQATALGNSAATHIGFVRVRSQSGGIPFAIGDTFDATTAWNSVQSNASAILGFLNGKSADLGYTGSYLAPLGLTTMLGSGASFQRGYAFLFSGNAGDVILRSNSVFSANDTGGRFDYTPAPVPLPAGLPLLAGALGLTGFVSRRRRARRT